MSKPKLTIVLSGMLAGDPHQGGASWAVLQYLLGFQQLGHDVLFIEPVRQETLRPTGISLTASASAAYFRQVAAEFSLGNLASLILSGTRQTVGREYDYLREFARRADVLVNISGMLTDPEILSNIPIRIYLDLDPAFNQLWHAVQGIDMRFAGHTHFVTVGQALGKPGCRVPTCGRSWLPTLPPVVLAHWPVAREAHDDALTTVGNWRGYGSVEHEGLFYGQKAHSLRKFLTLPTLTGQNFLLALAIHPDEIKDLAALAENGWQLVDPVRVAGSPAGYKQFIQSSRAEFGIAKSGYVVSQCGWFSDRSVCYLASGAPVIAQDTGFSDFLPTGEGLFAFRTAADVMRAIEKLRHDYQHHCRAARALAEEYFDSDQVLVRLLRRVGAIQ